MGVSRLEVQIDELVLHGFAPADRLRIGEAVQRELARLIGEGDIARLARGRAEMARLDAGSFQVAAGGDPEVIGGQVARAVHAGLTGDAGRK
jgi:hypothetical protein